MEQETDSLRQSVRLLNPIQIQAVLDELNPKDQSVLLYNWYLWAREKQLVPPGDWAYWVIKAGRGFGKTRTGAETVRQWKDKYPIIHLIARTAADARDTMIEGESGILAVSPPWDRPLYEPSKRRITWNNGARATIFSAEEPDALRGPQCYAGWCDELASWKYAQDTWDNYLFGLRLGDDTKTIITTTPRYIPVLKDIINDPATIVTSGSTFENKENLSKTFFNTVIKKYDGTRLGKQEIYAELLEEVEGALWNMSMIEQYRVSEMPELVRLVIPIDPAVTSKDTSDDTGIVPVGMDANGRLYVIEDLTGIYTPQQTMRVAVGAYDKLKADTIVAEVNNGGDYIEEMLKLIGGDIPYNSVWASRGKVTRAEPIVMLYEQGRVHHIGVLDKLEDEMTTWDAKAGDKSPNRIDSLVWGLTDLMSNKIDTNVWA